MFLYAGGSSSSIRSSLINLIGDGRIQTNRLEEIIKRQKEEEIQTVILQTGRERVDNLGIMVLIFFLKITEIKSRLKLGNACYHSVQNLLSSSLLSKNLKIKIYRTIILPVVLYGCETWSLTLR